MGRKPPLSAWSHLAYYSPLSSTEISTKVCARSAPLLALDFRGKKTLRSSVLNYMITSNHVHLLIKDTGPNVIANSMQLIAGRSAQE
jgi:hypothetical protein